VRLAAALVALVGLAMAGLVVWCVAARIPYPHELSKMEGGFVDHARWAAAGRPLYAPPSAEFVPFLYMPLAHEAAGALIRCGLDGYSAARLVSIAGILGAIAIGMALVARATGRRALALLVPALVAARYFDVECFYDQARPDNLMACFCMAAVAALALPSARASVLLFAASGLLAFFTKQSSLLVLAALLAGATWARWRVAVAAGALFAAAALPLFFWLDAGSGGWLRRYTFGIAASHDVSRSGLLALATSEFLNHFALVTAAAVVAAIAVLRARRPQVGSRDGRYFARHMALSGALAAAAFSLASSTQVLAVRNVYVIYAVAAAAFLPIATDAFVQRFSSERGRRIAWTAALLVLAVDVGRGARNPRPDDPRRDDAKNWAPAAGDLEPWDRLLATCARFGPPERTWLALHGAPWGGRAGDPFHCHFGALCDLVGGTFGKKTDLEIPADLRERVDRQWYASIVVEGWDERAHALIEGRYERAADVEPIRLPMFSGYGTSRSEVWVPKRAP